jgi:hypothetical protein
MTSYESPWVQTISWGQPADEARVLYDLCVVLPDQSFT